MKVGSRYSLPTGLNGVTLKSYSSNVDMEDSNAKTRPWYILWKGRSFIPPKKDAPPPPPSSDKSSTKKKRTLERSKSKKDDSEKADNEEESGSGSSIKRKDTFRRRFSLRMRKTALRHTLSSTTTSTATSSEYQSDDPGDSDDYSDDGDDDTLVNSIKLSSQTLSLGGADDNFADQDGTANRLTQLFVNDINTIVERTMSLPNGPEKTEMIHSVLEALKPIHNMAKLNLCFVILSSHSTEESLRTSEEDSTKEKTNIH